jgi:endonuclease-3
MIVGKYGGYVPTEISDLVNLAGVGYKTANVFVSVFYGKGKGIAVDTHVARVFKRLELTTENDATKIAKQLESLFPKKDWPKINSTFVLFGRYVCKAKKPECEGCNLMNICSYYTSKKSL